MRKKIKPKKMLDVQFLKDEMNTYVASGMNIPVGLLEDYKKQTHGRDFEPSDFSKYSYKLLNGYAYKTK